MEQSASTVVPIQVDQIATALAKAQGEFPVIPKDSEVKVNSKEGKFLYSYKYADLTTIIAATRPAMSKNGLSFTQGMVPGGFVTTLMHGSGQTLDCGFIPMEIPKSQDMKAVAAAITYVKRISLTAALGVSADEDVDAASVEATQGNSTHKGPAVKGKPQDKPPAQKPPQKDFADKDMLDQMLDKMIDRNVHDNSINTLICKGYGFKREQLPIWVWNEIMVLLDNEDCTDKTLERKYNEVLKRRESAQKKG